MNQPERTIVHMDLDAFFVSVERLKDSRLNGIPLIIGGKSGRAVVSSCSYEARKYGVHSAMPMRLARQLCPDAFVISGDFEAYTQYSQMVSEIIRGAAPLYEKASIDEFYIDASGMDRFFGTYKWAGELRNKIQHETGLPISFGQSINKMVSKVATNTAKPNGTLQIPAGTEGPFLAPMPVSNLPMVGKQMTQSLVHMGIVRVLELREIPRSILARIFGKPGHMLWERARGIDHSPVTPHSERKSISAERTFQQDTIDIRFLHSVLTRLTEKLAFKLRDSQKLTACITVKLRYSNFDTVTRQERIAYSANDRILIQKSLSLFDRLYDRRLLVRLVGVRLSHLVYGGHQVDLFDDTFQDLSLSQALDHIRRRYGVNAIQHASSLYSNR